MPGVSIPVVLCVIFHQQMRFLLQVQNDLTKDGGYLYFIKHLESDDAEIVPESRAQAAFVLAAICRNNKKGKLLCAQAGLLQTCSAQIPATAAAFSSTQRMGSDGSQQLELLLKWLIICVGHLCEDVQEIWSLAVESQVSFARLILFFHSNLIYLCSCRYLICLLIYLGPILRISGHL